jgi:hypothetical protein
MLGLVGLHGWGVLSSTKFAIEGLSDALRTELAPFGVTVTAVQPGFFRTDFLDSTSLHVVANRLAAYTDGPAAQMWVLSSQASHNQTGDPAKAAKAIVDLVESGRAPERLPPWARRDPDHRDQDRQPYRAKQLKPQVLPHRSQHTRTQREGHRVGTVAQLEAGHDSGYDVLDRTLGVVQPGGHLGGVHTLGQQLEYLDLAHGESGGRQTEGREDVVLDRPELIDQVPLHRPWQLRPPVVGRHHRPDDPVEARLLPG